MHEPRTIHRLNHPTHRLVVHRHPPRQAIQAVTVRRRPEMLDQLPLTRDQAHIHPLTAEIQTHVLPELAGIGAVPAWRAKHASMRNRSAPAVWPMRIAAVTGPHPRSGSTCGPQSGDDELS
jgi:hypothetical protein